MKIELMTKLQNNLAAKNDYGIVKVCRGVSEYTITTLENTYCSINHPKFPKTLKEFLFLAGAYNPYFDSGIGYHAIHRIQNEIRNIFISEGHIFSISNFWIFSDYDEECYLIDLNEDSDDPRVYCMNPYKGISDSGGVYKEYILPTEHTFLSLVENCINEMNKEGYSPMPYVDFDELD